MEDAVERLRDGELALHELEDELPPDEAADARRRYVADLEGVTLDEMGEVHDAQEAATNVENAVGATRIPLGVAGPLGVKGGYASGEYRLPMATTEGALVASTNRGCSAITEAGGATARVLKDGMTRAPVFRVSGVDAAAELTDWLAENFDALRDSASETTGHGELTDAEPYVAGDNVYVRFTYSTGDAMGMNMATVATRAASEVVEDETDAELVALSGNVCADKKPAAINAVEGRGRTVAADVLLPREVVREKLKTTPEAVAEVNERKTLVGSARAGTLGANAHAANVLSAVYVATGQDPAQVVEGSSAYTTASVRDGDLYVSTTVPAVEVGTVGGGTRLPTQNEALELLGVAGGGEPAGANARELAEVVAGGVLAGELSLHAALASRHLEEAHTRLGRDA
ncbi:hydroxymethylglutaryl-CoA reductase (NADPH) [Haladaptatus sp. F3-133]|uniref:3-hydroxy-3-methylglutaryl coenzyme A reductase n=1 Tax=Halorutilus salinus TaxID=2487751 RepID=A0A9Q4C5Y7_9EURY|nr:hydroxymethylglutaryl-CoA reductase (NADPH) [Halorutilus salinus]MCX2819009.1 hydroxymethylglutaryl-CoA reductase (NADPH) [Halorutilus salinus]